MKKYDLVSIVIPCYNQAQYLEEAVQSAVDQTYPNIEIIIVNDGSPDNTQEISEELQRKYPEKIQIISQENGGLYAARNSGIEKSSAKYIIPLDADDKLHNTMVQKCINTMNEYNADIVYSGYQGFGISDRVNMWKPFEQTTPLYNTPCSALALIKKKVWETNNGYKQNMHDGYEDWEFWINAYKHNFRFKHIDEKLYFYRIKDESMFVDAYKKDMYLRAKIVMNHPELYTEHKTLQATRTIKEAEKLADLYFYFTQNTTIDTDQFNSVLNNYLNNNSLNKLQVITFSDMNIGLCTLDLFEDIHSLDDLSKEVGTDLIFFYSPLRYEVSELTHSKFAWDQNKGIVKSQGTLFPFVPRSVKDDLKNTKFTAKNLEMYYEYTQNKMDNLQHKYDIDISNAQKKFDSLQHKYNIDITNAQKKFDNLQKKFDNLQKKFDNLQKKYNMDTDTANKKYAEASSFIASQKKKITELNTQISLIHASLSYRLGHTLIHEKKALLNPMKLFKKVKTIKTIIGEKRVQQKTKNTHKYKTVVTGKSASKANMNTIVSASKPIPTKENASEHKTVITNEKLQTSTTLSKEETFKDGICIILPTYKGQETINRVLTSLAKQDLSHDLFEVIIIINGEKDNTENIISEFSKENPSLSIRTFILNDSGASLARNKGIGEINHKYTVLLDDDDSVSPTFLSAMYDLAADDTIVLSQIINIDKNSVDASNAINMQILQADPLKDNLLRKCPSVLTINACKLIPSIYIKQIKFDTSLKSGEDVVYFSELFSRSSFKFKIAKEAIYFRFIKQKSVSRQPLSFGFNVEERLRVISRVYDSLSNTENKDIQVFLQQKISAQINFINTYLKEFPDDYQRTLHEINKNKLYSFPYHKLQKNSAAKDLIISYCFTPYVDTSAIVMAKRIREEDKIVDVVYNTMETVRTKDERLNALADDLIGTRIPINTSTSFNQWNAIELFSKTMLKRIEQLNKNHYESIYSRVMWPASNFSAFEYKLKNPNIKWIAEFSDPILYDIHGKERYSKIDSEWHYQEIEVLLTKRDLKMPKNDNLFFWCEYLAYVFADELIFTNKNQLSYMLEKTEHDIHDIITEKSIIKSHPTLSKKYYQIRPSNYSLNTDKVNLAYFGAFYQTRKLNDIVEVIKVLPQEYKEKVVVHVFTNSREELTSLIKEEKLSENFRVNDYVSYFEFLNLTTKFNCLILNDAITKPEKSVNPYLPSKLSDYRGSSASIWALYEDDSIISKSKDIKYKSELGNIDESCKVLEKIIDNHHTGN